MTASFRHGWWPNGARAAPIKRVLREAASWLVRIIASAPGALESGEYRSHLRLMSAPLSAGATQVTGEAGSDNSLSIELVAIRSITIPVILRVGNLDASVTMDAAGMAENAPDPLVVRLTREGTRSTYGDVSLTIEGERQPAWLVRGVAIYTPNTSRDVIVPLPAEVLARLAGKRVRIEYTSTDAGDPATSGKLLASVTTSL